MSWGPHKGLKLVFKTEQIHEITSNGTMNSNIEIVKMFLQQKNFTLEKIIGLCQSPNSE